MGNRKNYNRYLLMLRYFELIKEIAIVGVTSNDQYYAQLDGYKFIPKEKLSVADFNYVVVTNWTMYEDICKEASYYGIKATKILSAQIMDIPCFSFRRYLELLNKNISIIACNCWGGITYHYFQLPFLSPFINMFIDDDDFIRLIANFKQYMNCDLSLLKTEYNSALNIVYPVFLLGDIKLHMNHYADFDLAIQKWEERKARINWQELFFMMFTSRKDIAQAFSQNNIRGVCFVPFAMETKLVMPVNFYQKIERDISKFYNVVNGFAWGQYHYYDAWELLLNDRFVYRIQL